MFSGIPVVSATNENKINLRFSLARENFPEIDVRTNIIVITFSTISMPYPSKIFILSLWWSSQPAGIFFFFLFLGFYSSTYILVISCSSLSCSSAFLRPCCAYFSVSFHTNGFVKYFIHSFLIFSSTVCSFSFLALLKWLLSRACTFAPLHTLFQSFIPLIFSCAPFSTFRNMFLASSLKYFGYIAKEYRLNSE